MDDLREFALVFPAWWYGALGVLGLIVGSFLNVVIYRLPIMLERRWRQDIELQTGVTDVEHVTSYNLCWPPSSCPHCQQAIAVKDNIPLFSWLWLRGRSRCCHQPVSVQYPLVEVITMLAFLVAGLLWLPGIALCGALILLSFLVVLTVIDIKTLLLPDVLTLSLLWMGLLFNLSETFVPLRDAVVGAMAGYLSLWLLYWVFKYATGKEALGYGDFKLLAALGAWLGWQALPNLVLVAALSGLVVTLIWRGVRKEDTAKPLAFGPWLAIGGVFGVIMNGLYL
ncbi:prepilin peptidase [Pectobacterium aroidearum]|uniref:Prepilin leader peptidase/N-methyltransferase n=1 Tax=Pectobacterium aroidearum TaxID=1201031 RepID=A0ABR5ZBE9_9GAMM|nr:MULTISPECIES: A24 family peptidase [Pectobacterium]MBA5199074.1 prepilin peptidase [Pectobacterium aroidearum]MBA5226447.1 prepilin peptidase [Pectobacterium aroidearum]MBA5231866.1 prepilin peptidase [Pectobacterium aroidearum]MBA5737030.1 prepilin peptidase [Pectobacterium aroidearum]UXJ99079.1 A24 family peptidase [Pectobacterium aroidearum]